MKILIITRPFYRTYPKHKAKFSVLRAIEKLSDVRIWYSDGHLPDILLELSKSNFSPDFIFHYDVAYEYALAPNITGMNETPIPKGAFVIDIHFDKNVRNHYFKSNNIDLIFSVTKEAFLNTYPEHSEKFRWMPWSIDPHVFKDWNLNKDIDYLLMGLVHPYGKYPFREIVLKTMKKKDGFFFHRHPGHNTYNGEGVFLDEKYAKEINRSKIFFTCGSKLKYPVLKFFEIPACKTLLLAESNQDIVDLGFKDTENYIERNQSDFLDKRKILHYK